jgi:Undecaprenyl-phosphate glucose phosphotransferase
MRSRAVQLIRPFWKSSQERSSARRISPSIVSGVVGTLDALLIFAAAQIAFYLRMPENLHLRTQPGGPVNLVLEQYIAVSAAAALLTVGLIHTSGAYHFERFRDAHYQYRRVFLTTAAVFVGLIVVAFFTKVSDSWSRGWVIAWFALSVALLWGHRTVLQLRVRSWDAHGRLRSVIAIVGANDIAKRFIEHLEEHDPAAIEIVGLFDDRRGNLKRPIPSEIGKHRVLGTVQTLIDVAREVSLDAIVVCLPWSAETRVMATLNRLKLTPVPVRLMFQTSDLHKMFRQLGDYSGLPVLHLTERPLSDWQRVLKRVEDLALAGTLLLLLSPVMLAIALAIKLTSPGPVLFRQLRYGFNNTLIPVLKFRTMRAEVSDPRGGEQARPGDPRVTPIGAVLRRWSLDELPQLLNVLRGDMSVVGPRPHPVSMKAVDRKYEELVEEYAGRHRVKPGITGWAQVNGWRGDTRTRERALRRIEADLFYIEKWSLWFDLKILLMTLPSVLSGKNAY